MGEGVKERKPWKLAEFITSSVCMSLTGPVWGWGEERVGTKRKNLYMCIQS
jgi:hypothetical protein